jgi:hypothetical protein
MPSIDIDTRALLVETNAYAQRKFRAMLDARTYGDPAASETKAYVKAERLVDELLAGVQWETAKAALDELQAGDHFVYPEPVR